MAHSAEEAMNMMQETVFQVAVVDLHMPKIAGTDFCRNVRKHESEMVDDAHPATVESGEEGNEDQPSMKLLLHTTSAGCIESAELEVLYSSIMS